MDGAGHPRWSRSPVPAGNHALYGNPRSSANSFGSHFPYSCFVHTTADIDYRLDAKFSAQVDSRTYTSSRCSVDGFRPYNSSIGFVASVASSRSSVSGRRTTYSSDRIPAADSSLTVSVSSLSCFFKLAGPITGPCTQAPANTSSDTHTLSIPAHILHLDTTARTLILGFAVEIVGLSFTIHPFRLGVAAFYLVDGSHPATEPSTRRGHS